MQKIELRLGDSLEIMKTMLDKSVDLILTDPPYGIGYYGMGRPGEVVYDKMKNEVGMKLDYEFLIQELERIGNTVIIFGAQNFMKSLPRNGRWLCWDKYSQRKESSHVLTSTFELAWINKDSGYNRIYRVLHCGYFNADRNLGPRIHPTQKPTKLMRMIVQDFSEIGDVVFDPFMGGGSTGIACKQTGRDFIGIEIEKQYFDEAKKRIDNAILPILFTSKL